MRKRPLILAALVVIGAVGLTWFVHGQRAPEAKPEGLKHALAQPYAAPEFSGAETWVNTDPMTLASLRGKVVLIDFWTYSCINCIRTMPFVNKWYDTYKDKGLVVIGMHAPEFDFEKDIGNVKMAMEKYEVKHPVVLDNDREIWTRFHNRYWPAHYLIDKQGRVVYTHFGEGKYQEMENNIRYLLQLEGAVDVETPQVVSEGQTPETYLGYARQKNFAGTTVRNASSDYSFPPTLAQHHWALQGRWTIGKQSITAADKGSALMLQFFAKKVFLVLGTSGAPVDANVRLNGGETTTIHVDKHMLYTLAEQEAPQSGVVTIEAQGPELQAYAFTFGN